MSSHLKTNRLFFVDSLSFSKQTYGGSPPVVKLVFSLRAA